MPGKKQSQLVAARFIKAMKQVIANEIKGVTNRSEFAEKIGEYKQNISAIEGSTRYPTIDLLCSICIEFDVNPGWLLLEQGNMFSTGGSITDIGVLRRLNEIEKMVNDRFPKPKKGQPVRRARA